MAIITEKSQTKIEIELCFTAVKSDKLCWSNHNV